MCVCVCGGVGGGGGGGGSENWYVELVALGTDFFHLH